MLERVRDLLAHDDGTLRRVLSGDLSDDDRALELGPGAPDLEHEQRDIHEIDEILASIGSRDLPRTALAPRSSRRIRGMGGRVYDFRGTGLCPPVMSNGRPVRITPAVYIHHIPVIRNARGTGDLITLGNVCRAQGLSVHSGTDAEGNVALYTGMDELCYHARGVNSYSIGTEHMHWSIGEAWSERQMRAAAWLAYRAHYYHGIPLVDGVLRSGNGIATVRRRGHSTHEIEANAAGYHDRTDPGAQFRRRHVYELATFYAKHHRF